jgi:hypothetical protein
MVSPVLAAPLYWSYPGPVRLARRLAIDQRSKAVRSARALPIVKLVEG